MLTKLKQLYYSLFPAHQWEYSHDNCVRTCALTGVVEAMYFDDWGSWWEPYNETKPEPGSGW